nr:DUF2798 domain-containing protein [Sulfuriflexus mobilis]
MAALMSLFMSGVITLVNTSIDAGFIQRWMHAFYIALPMAFIALLVLRPLASLITRAVMRE